MTRRPISFQPIIAEGCRILILGSMPGIASLEAGEYYGHPRNRFWKAIETLTGINRSLPYATRCGRLGDFGIGLWDVLKECDREGSLDSAIRGGKPNDFPSLFDCYPTVEVVAMNGQKSGDVFRKVVLPDLRTDVRERLRVLQLPSTSPANARGGFQALWRDWQQLQGWIDRRD